MTYNEYLKKLYKYLLQNKITPKQYQEFVKRSSYENWKSKKQRELVLKNFPKARTIK